MSTSSKAVKVEGSTICSKQTRHRDLVQPSHTRSVSRSNRRFWREKKSKRGQLLKANRRSKSSTKAGCRRTQAWLRTMSISSSHRTNSWRDLCPTGMTQSKYKTSKSDWKVHRSNWMLWRQVRDSSILWVRHSRQVVGLIRRRTRIIAREIWW